MKAIFLFLMVLSGLCAPTMAQEMATRPISCFGHEPGVLTPDDIGFFKDIQKAIETDNREWMANNISWPLFTSFRGVKGGIDSRKKFLKYYNEIVTTKVKTAVRKQKAEELFRNYQGVMIGNGDIWFGPEYQPRTQRKKCAYSIETIQDAPVYDNQ